MSQPIIANTNGIQKKKKQTPCGRKKYENVIIYLNKWWLSLPRHFGAKATSKNCALTRVLNCLLKQYANLGPCSS